MQVPRDLPRGAAAARDAEGPRPRKEIWTQCRARYGIGGPFLFGAFSIADAFYAPVVSRFRTYSVPMEGPVRAYAEAIWALPAMQKWIEGAKAETLRRARLCQPRSSDDSGAQNATARDR